MLAAAAIGATQIAFAATAFTADFGNGSTNDWSKSGGTWAVVGDGSQALRQSNATTANARMFAGDTDLGARI